MLNYETLKDLFVGRSSPYILRTWTARNQSSLLATYLQRVFDAFDQLGRLAKDNEHHQGGAGFELFVVVWESLYRYLLTANEHGGTRATTTTLGEYFEGAVFNPSSLADVVIKVTAVKQAKTKKNFDSLTSTDPDPATHVLLYASNNPGFEFTSCFKTSTPALLSVPLFSGGLQ